MNDTYKRNFRGFTLVELLVVITIIGILSSLTAVGVFYARTAAINAYIKSQLTQVELTLELYKNEYGEYPPSLADKNAVERHANSRWKRASIDYYGVLAAAFDLYDDNGDPDETRIDDLDESAIQATTLTFWLGGIRDGDELTGFSADVSKPFKTGGQRQEPMIEFEHKKNFLMFTYDDVDVPVFVVRGNPVAYFRGSANGAYAIKKPNGDIIPHFCGVPGFGVAIPYAKSGTLPASNDNGPWNDDSGWNPKDLSWFAPKKYQLVHPGLDGSFSPGDRETDKYGTCFATFSGENGMDRNDYDNIVNFTETSTIQGALE